MALLRSSRVGACIQVGEEEEAAYTLIVAINRRKLMKTVRIEPGPGQESVWDYPRPPRLEPYSRTIKIELNGQIIAQTSRAFRVLETSHPPVYYIPPADIWQAFLVPSPTRSTVCEWKGRTVYHSLAVGDRRSADAAWSYPDPTPAFRAIKDHLAFYAGKVDRCWVDDEQVQPQPGDFYGGWVTRQIVGPFKGGPGSWGW
jgi:uncharacterized protein (DUF427 family)